MSDKKAEERLVEFLDSEVNDYGLSYSFEFIEDLEGFEVVIKIDYSDDKANVFFRYNEENDDLELEMGEDIYETVREYDWRVKFFWMLVAPTVFKN